MITIRNGKTVSVVPTTAFKEIFSKQGWRLEETPKAVSEACDAIIEEPKSKKKGGKNSAGKNVTYTGTEDDSA